MSQVLFVLKEGQIAFWKYSRGSLVHATLNGNRWNEFAPDYWADWKEANQIGDSVDAILLSDKPNGFGDLPDWLQEGSDASSWTVALLAKLAKDDDLKDTGLVLSKGKAKYTLSEGDSTITYSLASTLKFALPKDEPRKEVAKPTPKEIVKPALKPTGIIGDSYNDPEALKLAVGTELQGVIVSIFKAMKRNYVKVDGLKEQVCFKSSDAKTFAVGDKVSLTVTKVDEGVKRVLYDVV